MISCSGLEFRCSELKYIDFYKKCSDIDRQPTAPRTGRTVDPRRGGARWTRAQTHGRVGRGWPRRLAPIDRVRRPRRPCQTAICGPATKRRIPRHPAREAAEQARDDRPRGCSSRPSHSTLLGPRTRRRLPPMKDKKRRQLHRVRNATPRPECRRPVRSAVGSSPSRRCCADAPILAPWR